MVVGGDAAGMSAAMQVRRRQPEREIVVLEKGRWTSYSACGIPYLVAGSVGELDDLVARSPETFRSEHGIDVRLGHEARAIDLGARTVEAWSDEAGGSVTVGFDTLHVATGARPLRPDLPGVDLPHVHGVQTLDDAAALEAKVTGEGVHRVVVVGGGYIGLEMAEAFVQRRLDVTLVEAADQLMPSLDPDVAAPLVDALRGMGIDVRLGSRLEAVEPGAVVAGGERVPADVVVLGLGVRPNAELASAAGIATGVKGAIRVDRRQRTSVEGVWAAGDCCESYHLVARAPVHIALGTVANKQGRVAGINMAGGYAAFPGALGTAVTKVCSVEIGRTGLSLAEAASLRVRGRRGDRGWGDAGGIPAGAQEDPHQGAGRAGDRTDARRAARGAGGDRQAHRRARHRDPGRDDRRGGRRAGPRVRAAVRARVGPGAHRRPEVGGAGLTPRSAHEND